MKQVIILISCVVIFSDCFSASVIATSGAALQANELFIPVGKMGNKLSLLELSKISVREYEQISGEQLNFIEKLNFKAAQKKIRNSINADGSIHNKFSKKVAYGFGDSFSDFHFGGFLLGFLLFLPGVLIAYLIGGDEDVKRPRVKWAWYGASIFAIIVLALLNGAV